MADLSLRWEHTHFVGFVMSRLIYFNCFNIPWQRLLLTPTFIRNGIMCGHVPRYVIFILKYDDTNMYPCYSNLLSIKILKPCKRFHGNLSTKP